MTGILPVENFEIETIFDKYDPRLTRFRENIFAEDLEKTLPPLFRNIRQQGGGIYSRVTSDCVSMCPDQECSSIFKETAV